ncbi:MAG: DEAD/DEAH box helicase [Chromatiales bacterium]|nr:DEAD/DEAH box helicase [Chromatiales bacterium]
MPDRSVFLYDTDQLHELAPASLVDRGVRWARENRVIDPIMEDGLLYGCVEDPEREDPLQVSLRHDDDGTLRVRCDCRGMDGPVCPHALALLVDHANHNDAGLIDAREEALKERQTKGRTEVRVRHSDGKPHFGYWNAATVGGDPTFKRSYRVQIRSLHQPHNRCNCPDFAFNQLGTCKHIEAVLHRIGKRRDYQQLSKQPPPIPYIHLSWDAQRGATIRLVRPASLPADLKSLLERHFDAEGIFTGRLPEDYFYLRDAIANRNDIDPGEDVRDHVHYLAEQARQRHNAEAISRRIADSGGQLPGIHARLYPYQTEGVAFLASTGRALLADDMGLGKTLQAIAAATWLHREAGVEKTLVVCPASLKHQWAREIERFAGTPAQIIQGKPEIRLAQYRATQAFAVINYELVQRDLSVINERFRPDLIVLDEAQRIKNWRTKLATAIKRLESRYAFVLTGTPLENRLEDLYSLMQVVDQRVLGPLWRYMADFHVTDDRGKVLGYRNLSVLRQRLAPVMLRRNRSLVRDQLPDRIEQRLDIDLTLRQWELHDSAMANAGQLALIAKRRPLTPSESKRLMSALQTARMACDAAGLVDKETEGSPKLDELKTLLDELCLQNGLKAVVFSQWERMTAMAEATLRKLGLGTVRLHGGVPSARRGELMDRFRDDDSIQVFLSTDAGGTGLNLQHAGVLINLDIPWNPAVLDQRIARVHRLGQKQRVQIINMVAINAYEEKVLGLVGSKRDLFDNVVDPQASEDAVGLSRRLLEEVVDQLTAKEAKESAEGSSDSVTMDSEEPAENGARSAGQPQRKPEGDPAITKAVLCLQDELGTRIQRILGSGGRLLAVLDRVDEAAAALAERLSEQVPVAVIDILSLRSLQRLEGAMGFAEAQEIVAGPPAGPSPLLRRAEENLRAAELLVGGGVAGPAGELLLSTMLAAAAKIADSPQVPTAQQAAVWLHSEILPQGRLGPRHAQSLMRALALAQSSALPEELLSSLADDARAMLAAALQAGNLTSN